MCRMKLLTAISREWRSGQAILHSTAP